MLLFYNQTASRCQAKSADMVKYPALRNCWLPRLIRKRRKIRLYQRGGKNDGSAPHLCIRHPWRAGARRCGSVRLGAEKAAEAAAPSPPRPIASIAAARGRYERDLNPARSEGLTAIAGYEYR